jgi:hypothetical protein
MHLLESMRRVFKAHVVQLVNHLVAAQKDVGLILNSGERAVEVKRELRTLK